MSSSFFNIDISGVNKKDPKGPVMIVDGTNLFIRSFSSYPTMNDHDVHIGGFFGFLDTLVRNITLYGVSEVCVSFDGDNTSSRRKEIYPEYKGNRKATTKLNRVIPHTVEQEQELLKEQMNLLIYYLNKMPVKLFQLTGVESDDVISYLIRNYYWKNRKVFILSSDKDFMQLLHNDNVFLISPVKRGGKYPVYNSSKVVEQYGVHPINMLLARSFEGDLSDNIKGVDKIGIKTLLKYFPELGEGEEVSVDYIIEKAGKLLEEKKKSKQLLNIVQSRDVVELNQTLMNLQTDSHFSIRNIEAIDSIMNDYKEKPDFKKIRSMLRNHGLQFCFIKNRRLDFIQFTKPIFSLYTKT